MQCHDANYSGSRHPFSAHHGAAVAQQPAAPLLASVATPRRPTHPPTHWHPPDRRCSYVADLAAGTFSVHHGVIVKRPGSGPNEPGSFLLEGHYALPTTLPSTR